MKERLMAPREDGHHKKLRDPAAIKADISIHQSIITTYDAGRRADLTQFLSHEIMAVPLAIADANSSCALQINR